MTVNENATQGDAPEANGKVVDHIEKDVDTVDVVVFFTDGSKLEITAWLDSCGGYVDGVIVELDFVGTADE